MSWALLPALLLVGVASADEWPQWRGPTRDGVWRETGIVERFESPQLKPRWTAKISSGYSGPTVADGRVYVTDRVTDDPTHGQAERVLCFAWETGEPLWKHVYACPYRGVGYPAGPRSSVTIDAGLAYSLGAKGHLYCLDAATGAVRWQHDLVADFEVDPAPLIWGFTTSPLVDGDLLIVQVGGAKSSGVVAFDKRTGEERWRSLDDRPSYSSPIITEQGTSRVLVCWLGDSIAGLDPATGKPYWRETFRPSRMILNVATPVRDGDHLFLTAFYDGAMMLRLDPERPAASVLWRRSGRSEVDTDALHSIISTPWLHGDHVYGVDSYGELRCLRADNGDRIWEDLTAVPKARWSTIHFVQNGDNTWMFNERGELLITRLSPQGLDVLSRAQLLRPTRAQLNQRGGVCWSHPAFAHRHVFARNDEELVCASLAAD